MAINPLPRMPLHSALALRDQSLQLMHEARIRRLPEWADAYERRVWSLDQVIARYAPEMAEVES